MKEEYEQMTKKEVSYNLKYVGKEKPDIKTGKIYKCVSEWYDESGKLDSLSVIDETGEDYIYFPSQFEEVNY